MHFQNSENNHFADSELLFFEVLERAIRLYSHIDRSYKIASRPGARKTAQLKITQEALSLMKAHIEELVNDFFSPELDESQKKLQFAQSLHSLSLIHTRVLIAIPRPHEPIELISYLRQTLLLDEAESDLPEVFASEDLGDQAHGRYIFLTPGHLPQGREKTKAITGNLLEFAEDALAPKSESQSQFDTDEKLGYVSLPRIDLGNPCRWPSLLHEVGHFRYKRKDVWRDFSAKLSNEAMTKALTDIAPFCMQSDTETCVAAMKMWLQECWCDAYAITMAGPAAFFAQMHAFLFSGTYLQMGRTSDGKYPPAWFRLKLLLTFAQSRFVSEDPAAKQRIFKEIEKDKKLIYRLFSVQVTEDAGLFNLLHLFRDFLGDAFPRESHVKTSNISSEVLTTLLEDLSNGLPIPSVEDSRSSQRAASPAEILLAGWFYRGDAYKREFLGEVVEWKSDSISNIETLIAILKAKVDRAEESLKRSIQMVEWFRILDESSKENASINTLPQDYPAQKEKIEHPPGLLSDVQISDLLASHKLRIIPLIDYERQVSGSVLDLRLGHNFEVFFSNVIGVTDPLLKRQDDNSDSMEMDVDFLRSISIGPGQFLLGHTLEYIKLPENVAAQIEGRSSFARLGLQIHMTANLVEAGFDGCLTLEIANCGNAPITLYPGMRIAQLRFFQLASSPRTPYGKLKNTKYRGLLSHNKTQQFSDWEVKAFQKAAARLKISLNNSSATGDIYD